MNTLKCFFGLTVAMFLTGCGGGGSRLNASNSEPWGDNGFRNPHTHPLTAVTVFDINGAMNAMAHRWGYAQGLSYNKLSKQGSETGWTQRVVGDGTVSIVRVNEDTARCEGTATLIADDTDESKRLRRNERRMQVRFKGPAVLSTANDFTADYNTIIPDWAVPYVLVADVEGEFRHPSVESKPPRRFDKVALYLNKESGEMLVEPVLKPETGGTSNPILLATESVFMRFFMFRVK